MPRPPKTYTIPLFEDIKCIATLEQEGKTQREMAEYYEISLGAFARYVKLYKETYMRYVSALTIQPALDLYNSEEYQEVLRENKYLAESKGRDNLRQDMTDRRLKLLEEQIASLVDAATVLAKERERK